MYKAHSPLNGDYSNYLGYSQAHNTSVYYYFLLEQLVVYLVAEKICGFDHLGRKR